MPENIHLKAVIPTESAGLRLDQVVSELFPEYSRAKWQSWIKGGQLQVDGKQFKPKDKIRGGETIELNAELSEVTHWQAEAIALNVIFDDEHLLVINKPAGMVTHPAAGNLQGTLVNALLHHYPALSNLPRAGLIHRLDKDTTGLLVVAKTLTAHTHLVQQLQNRTIDRHYLALVSGQLTAGGSIEAPIGRHPRHRTKMAVVASGKPARTHYRIAKRFSHHTLLNVKLDTGRTHQIRVHFSQQGHPLVGDSTYGGRFMPPKGASTELQQALTEFRRQALHAKQLAFCHPISGESLAFSAPIPQDFLRLIELLEQHDAKPN